MILIAKALRIIDREVTPLGSERVDIFDSVGRILAEDIIADMDLPPFDRSQMDGYAVKTSDAKNSPSTLKLVGESAAGSGYYKELKRGEAIRIMTGAPVPKGADAVQQIEMTEEFRGHVTLNEGAEKGRFIVSQGKETKAGDIILRTGERLTSENIAAPAAFGYAKIKVARRPRVAVISTGSEIVEINKKPRRDQIRNSNSVMLKSLGEQSGAVCNVFPITEDDLKNLGVVIANAVADTDIVVTTGGVSVGKYDLTKQAFENLGAEILFDKVALKPGKPTVFGKRKKKLFFGLPGNPVSAAVTFTLFVRRAIMLMQAARETAAARGFAVLHAGIKGTKTRDVYLPAKLATGACGELIAAPLPWLGSSDFIAYAQAQALIVIPKNTEIAEGEVADVLYL